MFHSRQTVCVAGHQDDALYSLVCRVIGNIEADPHVDAFLLEIRPEIVVRQWYCRNWNVLGLEAPKFQHTTADSEEVSSSKFS